jgi:hypothetical protein
MRRAPKKDGDHVVVQAVVESFRTLGSSSDILLSRFWPTTANEEMSEAMLGFIATSPGRILATAPERLLSGNPVSNWLPDASSSSGSFLDDLLTAFFEPKNPLVELEHSPAKARARHVNISIADIIDRSDQAWCPTYHRSFHI